MQRWIKRITLVALFLGAAIPASADIPNPDSNHGTVPESSNKRIEMRIEPNEKASEAKLTISRSVWQQLNAGVDEGHPQTTAASHFFSNLSGAQTAMAGIFLSLAFMFGGVWFVRSRGTADRLTRAALGVAVLALCGATASIAYANAGPPPVARSLTSKILLQELQWWGAYGEVKVEIVEDGDGITLVLPRPKEKSE